MIDSSEVSATSLAQRSRRNRRGALFAGAATLSLLGVSAAVDGRGCVATPLIGTPFRVSSTAANFPVQFAGQTNTNTTKLSVYVGRPSATPGELSFKSKVGDLPIDTVNDQFSGTLNIPRRVRTNDL